MAPFHPTQRDSRRCLIAAYALTVLWGALYAGFAHGALCDEPGHLGVLTHFAEHKLGWPDHLTTPPGYHLVALALGGGQPSLTAARLTSTLFALVGLTAFAGAWRRLHAQPAGPATLLFALLPIFQPFTGLAYNDVPALALLLCAFWAQLADRLPTATLALVLACLVRQTNLIWIPFLILWEIQRAPRPAGQTLTQHAVTIAFTRTRGYVIILVVAAALILYAGRLTPGTANRNDLRPNPAAFTFAALLFGALGLPVWFAHVRSAGKRWIAFARVHRVRTTASFIAGAALIAGFAATYTNPHEWNRELWWEGVRFTLLRNWPLIYIEKMPALRVVAGCGVILAVAAGAQLCRTAPHGRMLALSLLFSAALIGSNYLVDPRYYLTPAAFLLLLIRPARRDFFLLGGWWLLIALVHDPFILAGLSLW